MILPRLPLSLRWIITLALALFSSAPALHAHSHIDAQPNSSTNPTQLQLVGPDTETMVYVPAGEPFSYYASDFPGSYYACELTFSSEDTGPRPRIQLLSVSGPAGGTFAFWEVGATSPTWSRPTGWTSTNEDRPSLITYEDGSGYGHIHGRLFTATHPGTYTVVFRAIDDAGVLTPSAEKSITFTVQATPQLTLRIESGNAVLSFTSRLLTYDLQVSTDLQTWTTISTHDGTGEVIELTDPLNSRPRVFYRLVEYY
ncbi:MAG: hypothetical protein RL376_1883 [Verrucomicrobiota bacterium]|jgi:hypothetical protein